MRYLLIPAAIIIAMIIHYIVKRKRKVRFILYSIDSNIIINGAMWYECYSSSKQHTNMKALSFNDAAAKGKGVTVTVTVKADEAGNFPTFKEGSLRAEGENAVGKASLGESDPENGKYRLRIDFTGKNGSIDAKLIASPDLDNSGDADIEYLVSIVITTEEASAFDDNAEVSELN